MMKKGHPAADCGNLRRAAADFGLNPNPNPNPYIESNPNTNPFIQHGALLHRLPAAICGGL